LCLIRYDSGFGIEGKPVFLSGQPLALSAWRKFALVAGVATALSTSWLAPSLALAKGLASESASVALSELPKEAQQTEALIRSGGPFPYDKDGSVFGNRERLLPANRRGFYREYTVKTPGARNRGARRIVCGGTVPVRPESCFYTSDHYASFKRIVP
jgi:ribonuclease T1